MPKQQHTFSTSGHVRKTISNVRVLVMRLTSRMRHGSDQRGHDTARSQLKNGEYHLTVGQLEKLIRSASTTRDRVILRTLAETGLRRSEMVALQIEDVDLKGRLAVVRRGKGNKLRLVPLTRTLTRDLRSVIDGRSSGAVFLSQRGGHICARHLNRIVAKTGERAGIRTPNPKYRHLTCHLFRHSFARLWKARGGSIESLSKILGHESVRTTWDEYGSESLEDVRQNYAAIMEPKTTRAGQNAPHTKQRRMT